MSQTPGVLAIALKLTNGQWYKVVLPPEHWGRVLPPDQIANLKAAATGNLEVTMALQLELTPFDLEPDDDRA